MKKLFPLVMSGALMLSLCACGGGDDAQPAPEAADTPAPVEASQAPEEVVEEDSVIPIKLGESIENDFFKMSFDSVELLDEYSYDTSEYSSTSLYVEEGYKLLMLKGHCENVGTTTISDNSFIFTATVNGEYLVDDYDVRLNFIRDKSSEIDPYTDLDYVLYINIPEKLAEKYETVDFTIGFKNDLSTPSTIYGSDGSVTTDVETTYCISTN